MYAKPHIQNLSTLTAKSCCNVSFSLGSVKYIGDEEISYGCLPWN